MVWTIGVFKWIACITHMQDVGFVYTIIQAALCHVTCFSLSFLPQLRPFRLLVASNQLSLSGSGVVVVVFVLVADEDEVYARLVPM